MGIFEPPEGYAEIRRVDFIKDKKLAVLINIAGLVVFVAVYVLGIMFVPIDIRIASLHQVAIPLLVMGLAIIAFIVAHELIHGAFIKKYSGKKAKYGFSGLFAYAGSDAFFNKRQYIIIALAPVVILGALFLAFKLLLPVEWFWRVFFLQALSLSGATGDVYITMILRKMPTDMLVTDVGTTMVFYSRESITPPPTTVSPS